MAEFLADFRFASTRLPEDNTSRTSGGELVYAGKATRLGIAGSLMFSDNVAGGIMNTPYSVGDFANILIQIPAREHWFLRGFFFETERTVGTMSQVAVSLHQWRTRSLYRQTTKNWLSPNLQAVPPKAPSGLEPFAYREADYRQITEERTVPVAAPLRGVQWTLDKHIWQRHMYTREIFLVRIEIIQSSAGAEALLFPIFDVIRYPTEEEMIARMIQRDGKMLPSVTLAAMVQATQDRLSQED